MDHDYTLLAMTTYREGAREVYTSTISSLRRMDTNIIEPIKAFLQNEARSFREVRRNLDQSQRQYDSLQSRFSGLGRNKELSSLREEAFQLHEARKAYLKASMDFGVMAPQLRMALDKVLVRAFSNQWRETRQIYRAPLDRLGSEIERVSWWSREMESSENSMKRELQIVRKQIEETAELNLRPSRELEDYGVGSTPLSASRGPSSADLLNPTAKVQQQNQSSEKQGWLNLKTVTGKPSRTIWLRRWFYISHGIFGWLLQGSRSGAVEESERIGVLLCSIRRSQADDRRYVFEVKTKDITIVLQAETQSEISDWLATFETAKRRALENPTNTVPSGQGTPAQDPAFAISPASAPEFAASAVEAGTSPHIEEGSSLSAADRSLTLPVSGTDVTSRNSVDIVSQRRSFAERENEGGRDPASRIISKLDLHRKSAANDRGVGSPGLSGSGIASLIAASHNSMSVGPGPLPTPPTLEASILRKVSSPPPSVPSSTLAPNTLANPPAPTNLSTTAVIVSGERGVRGGGFDSTSFTPGGFTANIWGTNNSSHINVLAPQDSKSASRNPQSPLVRPLDSNTKPISSPGLPDVSQQEQPHDGPSTSPVSHRKTVSLDTNDKNIVVPLEYPENYPLQLKTQDAQFHLLFPTVKRDERVLLVFRATWNPNEQQEFSGRIYVTIKAMYFYSNVCGLTLISSIDLDTISEVTAAPGKECGFIFCHFQDGEGQPGSSRITLRIFLEPLNLLQRRLNFLVRNQSLQNLDIDNALKALIKLEQDDPDSGSGLDSWENISINTPVDNDTSSLRKGPGRNQQDLKTSLLIDRDLYGRGHAQLDGPSDSKPFKLPKQPVFYAPPGMHLAVEREIQVSPKALFHIMFGEKSAIFQLLYHERQASQIRQGPWSQNDPNGHLKRHFDYQIVYKDVLQRIRQAHIQDHQMIDVANEHLLYVVSDRKRPWHLPYRDDFFLHIKVVITHLAKSKCKLAIYIRTEWLKDHGYGQSIVTSSALKALESDALDLMDVVAEQVRNFASAHGRTKKAIDIFGQIPGAQSQVVEFAGSEAVLKTRLRQSTKPRTLTALAFESCASMLESVLTSAGQIIWSFIRWIWKTIDANYIILGILAISVVINMTLSSRSTSAWWKDRRARSFMNSIGIGSDLSMSKAIYLEDLHITSTLDLSTKEDVGSQCRDVFDTIMTPLSEDLMEPIKSHSSVKPVKSMNAHRLRKARQRLGTYRHDLLVATRVVNTIEREMVQAEWEEWIIQEHATCKQLAEILDRNATESTGSPTSGMADTSISGSDNFEDIKSWHRSYCESCDAERLLLKSV